jgi:hypothetical protein
MKLFANRKRQQAIRRIADRTFRHEAMLRSKGKQAFGHSVEDWVKLIDTQYTDEIIHRIDAYQEHSADCYPRLAIDLQRSSKGTVDHRSPASAFAMRLSWIETLTPILKSVIAKHGDPMESGFINAMDSTSEIINNTLEFLQFMHGDGAVANPEQQEALMAVSFLLIQSGEERVFAPHVDRAKGVALPCQTMTDGWLTIQALTRPTEAAVIAVEYHARMARRSNIASRLGSRPAAVQDHLCDYSDELIDQIVQLRKAHDPIYATLQSMFDGGASEASVRDILFFTPLTQMDSRTSSWHIRNLHTYKDLPSYDCYSQAPANVRDQCIALLTATHAVIEYNQWRYQNSDTLPMNTLPMNEFALGDERLVQLLLEHPHRADSIAAAIKERGSLDFDLISTVTADALSEGML